MTDQPKSRTYTPQELAALSPADLTALFVPGAKIEATFVVRDAQGRIKYDRPDLAGTYHEEHLT
ncbi:MAG: hypothetical protein AB7O32_00575 [Vicinamibacterales bacterium]